MSDKNEKEDEGCKEGLDEVICLDDECVIFPGLLDLHSHVEYSGFQLWDSKEKSKKAAWRTFMETGDSGVWAVIAGGRAVYADIAFLQAAMGMERTRSFML